MFHPKGVEEIKTHILCSIISFSPTNYEIYETRENIVKPDRPQIRRMRFVRRLTKVKETHSEYVRLYRFSTATVVMLRRYSVKSQHGACLVPH